MILYKDIEGYRFYVAEYEYDNVMEQVIVYNHTHDENEAINIVVPKVIRLLKDLEYKSLQDEYKRQYTKEMF